MVWQSKHYWENRTATFDCRQDSLYWFVVRSESMLARPCSSIWWFRLPPTTPLFIFVKPEVLPVVNSLRSLGRIQLWMYNPCNTIGWSVIVSQQGTVTQWIRMLKISLRLSGEVYIEKKKPTKKSWLHFVILWQSGFCEWIVNVPHLQQNEQRMSPRPNTHTLKKE